MAGAVVITRPLAQAAPLAAPQALLSLELGAAFPGIALLAEEDAAALRAPGAAALLSQARPPPPPAQPACRRRAPTTWRC